MIKNKIAWLLVVGCWLLVTPTMIFAHTVGQPSFFKVNGVFSNLYQVPLTSLSDFDLPQDAPPANYLINQSISFEMDLTRIQAPPEAVKRTKFTWDFGDGVKATGLKNNHTYTKMGSYILTIYADDGTTPIPQLLESILINVLPNPDYKLPQAKILVNNQTVKDPLLDKLNFPFTSKLNFDASSSIVDPSTQIVSYLWDFGDQQSSKQNIDTHLYVDSQSQVFPVLRIKDSNGFIGDTFLEVENTDVTEHGLTLTESATPKSTPVSVFSPNTKTYIIAGTVVVLLAVISGFLILKR